MIVVSLKLFRYAVPILIGLLLLARLIGMSVVPLMDTTEARYGEIGRKMFELNDWVTPWFDYGVPYWGKPPVSFWVTAISFKLFGINEFTARLPHLLFAIVLVSVVVWLAAHRDRDAALPTAALISGSFLYFISAGAVMTDIELVLGTTLAMAGFWFALEQDGARTNLTPEQIAGWLAGSMFFGGLVLGLLAKGPVALVLVGAPLFLWTAYNRRWLDAWRNLPWVRGVALTLLISLPWYWIAEQRTPGFFQYFILGEHWHRFVTPGWHGDLYGSAHIFPIGAIWAFALVDTLPWSILLPIAVWRWHKVGAASNFAPASNAADQNTTAAAVLKNELSDGATSRFCFGSSNERAWESYLLLWTLTPLLFFTAARNVIMTYVLPALPAAAVLGGSWIAGQARQGRQTNRLLCAGLLYTLAACTVAIAYLVQPEKMQHNSVKAMLAAYDQDRAAESALAATHPRELKSDVTEAPILFIWFRPFSSEFYSHGKAIKVADNSEAWQRIGTGSAYVATFWGDTFIASASLQKPRDSAMAADSAGAATNGRTVKRLGHFGDFDLLYIPAQ